jgi:hypothetical protein
MRFLHIGVAMRTNIEIDDKLMKKAMKVAGVKTKKAAVEEGLRLLVKSKAQEGIWKWFGKVEWNGPSKGESAKDKWEESEKRDNESRRTTRKKAA